MPDQLLSTARSIDLDVRRIVDAIDNILSDAKRPVALHEPVLGSRERQLVLDALDSGWVSSGGPHVSRFEAVVAHFVGVKHAVATVNGTTALHTALMVAGVSPGDEVLLPAVTFAATANAISHAGAIPHFIDSSWGTLGVDPDALALHLQNISELRNGILRNRMTGRPIRAIVPVHVFGHPVDLERILEVAADYRLLVIEDAAEAIGSAYRGKMCGSFGHCAALSFNGNKIITTGAGGMVLTSDDELAGAARHITTTAKRPHPWEFYHDQVGFNYRLSNLSAALGCAQMERIEEFMLAKRRLAERYLLAFRDVPGVRVMAEPAGGTSNYWLNTLILESQHAAKRDTILSELHQRQILARPIWIPMHKLPMYAECPRAPLPIAEEIHTRCINLPSSAFLA